MCNYKHFFPNVPPSCFINQTEQIYFYPAWCDRQNCCFPPGMPLLNRKWFPAFIPSSCCNLTGFGMKPVYLSSSLTTCFSHRNCRQQSSLSLVPYFHLVKSSTSTSVTPPLPPSVCPGPPDGTVCFHWATYTPPPAPPSSSRSAWHVVVPNLESVHYLFSGGNKKELLRATPASLTVTVSFPASFLLSTKHIIGVSN